jgi:PAS domain S-box-containing protein
VKITDDMYRRIVESVPEGIWIVDPEGHTIFGNRRMMEILGGDPRSDPDFTCFDSVFPEDRAQAQCHFERAISGDGRPFDFRLRRFDGSSIWVSICCMTMVDDAGAPFGLLGMFSDITERKRAETALRESEERFRNMADTVPVMIWVSDENKQITFFNKTWLNFTGRTSEHELGSGWAESVHPDDVAGCYGGFSSAFDARLNFNIEYRLRRWDGEYRWLLCSGVPRFDLEGSFSGYIGSDIDITDLRKAQEEVFARQKWESLGVLAGGVAHDFNNLLGSILAEAELADAELAEGVSPAEELNRIQAVAIRASEIVRELMIYSGHDRAILEPVDTSRLVEEMLELLKVSISKHAVLHTELGTGLLPVMGNAAQIRQIVMNLVINASEALGERGGIIKVRTSRTTRQDDLVPPGVSPLSDGEHLRLEVSDTGCGMSEDEKAKVFDPFFTTKFAGRGLGLAVVQGIVREHRGSIRLVSAPGQGTTFQILLPCAQPQVRPTQATADHAIEQKVPDRSASILVVEDEATLRQAISKLLQNNGLFVVEASDGAAALDVIRAPDQHVDLILLDVTLPGVPSRTVFEEAKHLRPDLRVIVTSAYSEELSTSSLGTSFERFIRKPYRLNDLMHLIHQTLKSPAAGL